MTNMLKNLKITPCTSERTGDAVKNQYIITAGSIRAFQSYDSLIAIYDRDNNKLVIGRHWGYSVTTLKYFYQYLRNDCYKIWRNLPEAKSGKASIQKAIDLGLIEYDSNMI